MRIPLQPVLFRGGRTTRMTTLLTTEVTAVEMPDATPGCGCCIPPPDTVDRRMAELQDRKERLERRLARLR